MTDEQIIAGIRRKDKATFDYIYRQYGGMLIAHVMKNSGSRTDGMETLQIALLRIWENINQNKYKDQGKFANYLYMVMANCWREELRRRKSQHIQSLGKTEEYLADEGDIEIYRKLVKEGNLSAIYRALDRLDSLCQEIIELYHLQEVPLKEVAALKNYDYNNLRKRIFNCRAKLKKLAEEELQRRKGD